MSSPSQNLQTMRTFISSVQQTGDLSLIDTLIHPDFHDHSHGPSNTVQGREWARVMIQNLHSALTNIHVEILHCVANENVVATHKVLRGTHSKGEFYGKAPSGKEIEVEIMDFVRFEDGLMREHWANVKGGV